MRKCSPVIGVVFLFMCFAAASSAQPQLDSAPPPLKVVSKSELAQLEASRDIKKRTQTALELMSARLKQAEVLIVQENLDQMYKELGGFHGLMDNTLAFLNASDRDSGKVLNNFKRFEIGLRQFRPRLELIRRDIPSNYEPYVRNLIMYVRDARSKAVEPMFGDSVVPRTKS
ncbi:MAG: hypothetical protein HOP17_08695 [Acidobacteria bacterium]|nr:hypothetical protein [Acidobacteriota bacterium]